MKSSVEPVERSLLEYSPGTSSVTDYMMNAQKQNNVFIVRKPDQETAKQRIKLESVKPKPPTRLPSEAHPV